MLMHRIDRLQEVGLQRVYAMRHHFARNKSDVCKSNPT